jgi:DNA-binding ferritin-like protein
MTTQEQLIQVFNDNFTAYYRSHVAHVNIVGRNFTSDHKLLQKIYEDLQAQIDTIAELLRTLEAYMPDNLSDVIDDSHIGAAPMVGDSDSMLSDVRLDLTHLKECYIELISVAESDGLQEVANYAQDRVLAIGKHIWMLDATLS